jgi:glycosyltransferase involved in cell wall biosynthesis
VISFVVPAFNEERVVSRTLGALHAAARSITPAEPYEIIVVDDGSTDGTAALAAECGARVVQVQHRHIARARNTGAWAARGTLLIFVDADTLVPAATLKATLEAVRDGAVAGGAVVRFDGPLPLYARFMVVLLRVSMRAGRLAAGCYLFCTRAAFDAVGGFDERLFATEELALSRVLRRHGQIVVLRETVETSGRKLRTHSAWELARLLAAFVRFGPTVLRSRDRLGLWYGARRTDPEG